MAYWGTGASKELGLDNRKGPFRIICDLWSGRCNPAEIKKLLKYGAEIKTRDKLHAKTYCISDRVIIGSSNASTNGLGIEGSEARSNIELNAAIRDADFVAAVRSWFEDEWHKAEPVDSTSAEDARPFWEAAQRNRPTQTSKTLLQGLAENNPRLRNASLWVEAYMGGQPSQNAKKEFRRSGEGKFTTEQLQAMKQYYPFYQDSSGKWPVQPGDVGLAFEFEQRTGMPEFCRMWRIRKDPFIPAPSKQLPKCRIVLCDLIDDYRGMRLPKREASLIAGAISAHLKANNQWDADRIPTNHEFLLRMPLGQFWKEHRDILAKPKSGA